MAVLYKWTLTKVANYAKVPNVTGTSEKVPRSSISPFRASVQKKFKRKDDWIGDINGSNDYIFVTIEDIQTSFLIKRREKQ